MPQYYLWDLMATAQYTVVLFTLTLADKQRLKIKHTSFDCKEVLYLLSKNMRKIGFIQTIWLIITTVGAASQWCVKWANDGLFQASDGKILVNDGEMLVNDVEMTVGAAS